MCLPIKAATASNAVKGPGCCKLGSSPTAHALVRHCVCTAERVSLGRCVCNHESVLITGALPVVLTAVDHWIVVAYSRFPGTSCDGDTLCHVQCRLVSTCSTGHVTGCLLLSVLTEWGAVPRWWRGVLSRDMRRGSQLYQTGPGPRNADTDRAMAESSRGRHSGGVCGRHSAACSRRPVLSPFKWADTTCRCKSGTAASEREAAAAVAAAGVTADSHYLTVTCPPPPVVVAATRDTTLRQKIDNSFRYHGAEGDHRWRSSRSALRHAREPHGSCSSVPQCCQRQRAPKQAIESIKLAVERNMLPSNFRCRMMTSLDDDAQH